MAKKECHESIVEVAIALWEGIVWVGDGDWKGRGKGGVIWLQVDAITDEGLVGGGV